MIKDKINNNNSFDVLNKRVKLVIYSKNKMKQNKKE